MSSNVPTLPEHGPYKMEVQDLVAFLARPHMMEALYTINEVCTPPVRFNEIMKHVACSPTTLTARLKEAVDAGLLTRTTYDENPPRVEYGPTPKTLALVPAFMALGDWCQENDLNPATEAVT